MAWTKERLAGLIDHTNLKPTATWGDIVRLCEEATLLHTASVCIPPSYVHSVKHSFGTLNICTVVGFPLGYSTTEAKVGEVKQLVWSGANEIDMVVNGTDIKNGEFLRVEEEIKYVKQACTDKVVLKVIIETCNLTEAEKIAMCEVVSNSGADYIKTSTGFGSQGAAEEDIRLFKEHLKPEVKIKAAGGIRTMEDLLKFAQLGCHRIGCSATAAILSC
ncbi:MAG: deoxyribose-phosphate aldolase [Oscillospiraceae bacterium]|nr:deoxyribose-phosphate aldolase [Oscillospiraceae bacterium]